MIRLLLDSNADINIADKTNWTAVDYLEYHMRSKRDEIDTDLKSKLIQIRNDMTRRMDTRFLGKKGKTGALIKNTGEEDHFEDDFIIEDPNLMSSRKNTCNNNKICEKSNETSVGRNSRPFSDSRDMFRKRSKLSRRINHDPIEKENDFDNSILKKRKSNSDDFVAPSNNFLPSNDDVALANPIKKKIKVINEEIYEDIPVQIQAAEIHDAGNADSNSAPKVTPEEMNINIDTNFLNFTVKIEDKSILCIIDKMATVKDLAEDASKRYFKLYDKRYIQWWTKWFRDAHI